MAVQQTNTTKKLMKIEIKNLSEFIPALEDCFVEMYIKRLDSLARITITYKDSKYKTTLTNKTSIEAEYDNFVARLFA
jgi:hypothetical protein